MAKQFFMVKCVTSPGSQGYPASFGFVHETVESANLEARRLACENPGREFAVLTMTHTFIVPIGVMEIRKPIGEPELIDDEIPF